MMNFILHQGLYDAGAFDDVAFIYNKQCNNCYQCVLIQAKHVNIEKIKKKKGEQIR